MALDNFNKQLDDVVARESGLKRGMKGRHLFMITLGGVIGTGLFLSSGYTINQAGPGGAVAAYLLGGFIMYMVMLCLGELAVAMPVAGSFQTYAREFIHPSVGFILGWLFWLNGATTIGIDLVAAGILLKNLIPSISEWVWVLSFGVLLFGLNSLSVAAFGESEFWFAGIKVSAIIACIIVGTLAMLGLIGDHGAIGFTNYVADGGLFPNGLGAIMLAMVTVAFAFNGTEIIGIAAGESENPQKTIPSAVNGTAVRTLLCYVLSMIVIVGIVPWKTAGVSESIFAEVFQYAGIPGAYTIMTLVVVTSALSCGNSWAYSASRILWAMAKDGMAPSCFATLNRYQVPMNALIVTMAVAGISLLCSVYAATTVYLWLIAICGLAGVLGWMGICASQYFFRKRYTEHGGKVEDLAYKTPFFPLVPALGFFLNLAVAVSLWFVPDQRIAIYTGVPFVLVMMAYYFIVVAPRRCAMAIKRSV
jgi:amino acid permease